MLNREQTRKVKPKRQLNKLRLKCKLDLPEELTHQVQLIQVAAVPVHPR